MRGFQGRLGGRGGGAGADDEFGGEAARFGLFAAQLVSPAVVGLLPGESLMGLEADDTRQFFAVLYFVAASALVLDSPHRLKNIWAGRRAAPALETSGGIL